jgi:hypothetical protein
MNKSIQSKKEEGNGEVLVTFISCASVKINLKKNKKYIILIHLRIKNTLKYNHYHTFKYPLSTEEMEKHLYHLQVIAMMNNNWEGKKFSSFFISFEAKDGTRNIYKFLEMINQHNRSTVALAF